MYRWYALCLLALTYAFSVMDRQILAILLEDLRAEFALNDTQLGLLSGLAFALFYAGLGVPIARLADRWNRMNIISIAVALWSMATACCGAAQSFWQLFAARVGVGVGEAGGNAPSHSVISDYFEPEKRGFAMSIYSLGTSVGGLLGLVGGGFVAEYYGWRWAFVALGVPGIFLAIVVKLTVREPTRGAMERSQAAPLADTDSFWQATRKLMSITVYRQVLIGHTLAVFVGYAIFSWLAALYLRSFETGQGEVGSIIGAINLVCGVPGLLVGGLLADKLGSKDIRWRMRVPAIALGFALPLYLAALWQQSMMIMSILVGAAIFCYQASHAPGLAVVQSVVPSNKRAFAASLVFLFANLLGLGLGPLIVGAVSDYFQQRHADSSLRIALSIAMLVLIPAIYWYWVSAASLGRQTEEVKAIV